MKAVLMSIQPKWCELISNGEKTVEVRKTRPKLETPFKVYIYCTQNKEKRIGHWLSLYCDSGQISTDIRLEDACYQLNGKVIGEFVCDVIYELHDWHLDPRGVYQEIGEENLKNFLKMTQLTYDELCVYRNGMPYYKPLYAWHISSLVIYDKPKELSEFKQCHKCEYYANCYEHEYSCDGVYNLTRPPQSWCYVEEKE